jgi:hypothetical protein
LHCLGQSFPQAYLFPQLPVPTKSNTITLMKNKPSSSAARSSIRDAAAGSTTKPAIFFQKQLAGEEPLTWRTADRLYALSIEIMGLRPWKFLADQDIFLLRDPRSGEMCHCSIMGALGEVFSLHVYVGDESYRTFRRLASGGKMTPEEFLASQKGVSVEFVRLSEVTQPDRELLKCFNHPLQRGLLAPIFRALRPGFHGWHVTEPEGTLLAECMQALVAFSKVFLANPESSYWDEEDVYPLLVPAGESGAQRTYEVKSERAPEPPPAVAKPAPLDEIRVQTVLRKDYTLQGCLEADCFLAMGMVGGKNERKACIRMGMVADAASGFLFRPEVAAASQPSGDILVNGLLNAIDDARRLPMEVHVTKEEFRTLLQPFSQQLGIPVKVVKSLPALKAAKSGVMKMMSGMG